MKNIKLYEFLEEKHDEKSLNNFAEDFYIDPEFVESKINDKVNTFNDCDSIKDMIVDNDPIHDIKENVNTNKCNNNIKYPNKSSNDEKSNLFWNVQNNFKEDKEDDCNSKQKSKSKSKVRNKIKQNTQLNKNNHAKVDISCCLSRVDKGNALLVTNHDQIIKIPKHYLPNNYLKGNSFKISVEEIEKSSQKYEKIRFLQNKYFFK